MTADYQQQLGARLRAIRRQQGLTLQEIEDRSHGEWKAVVIGSYERGDRAISVSKLARLAAFYGVPVGDLLPAAAIDNGASSAGGQGARVVLDLTQLGGATDGRPEFAMLERFASRIAIERGDYNGRMLTLRAGDLRTIAAAVGSEPDEMLTELAERDAIITR